MIIIRQNQLRIGKLATNSNKAIKAKIESQNKENKKEPVKPVHSKKKPIKAVYNQKEAIKAIYGERKSMKTLHNHKESMKTAYNKTSLATIDDIRRHKVVSELNQAKSYLNSYSPVRLSQKLNNISFLKEKSISYSLKFKEQEMYKDIHSGLIIKHNEEEKHYKNGFKNYMTLKSYNEHKRFQRCSRRKKSTKGIDFEVLI